MLRNFLAVGDMFHSVQFLLWREADYSLNLVAKDHDQLTALSTAFVHDGPKLGMLVADDEGNVQMLQENPK